MPAKPRIVFSHAGLHLYRLTVFDGHTTFADLGKTESVISLVRRLRFAIAALGVDPSSSVAVSRAASSLEHALFSGIDAVDRGTIGVRPGPQLMSVPWRHLPMHRDGRIAIRLRTDAVVSHAAGPPRSILSVACAADNPNASIEAEAVSLIYERSSLLVGRTATPESFLAGCATHDVIHIAGYRTLIEPSSIETNIRLDGGNLSLFEIGQLAIVAPTVVIATSKPNAIDSFSHEVNYAFAHSLIARGATRVILAPIDLAPEISAVVMPALHRHLAQGLDPVDALDALRFDNSELQRAADTLVCIEAEPASRPPR